MVRPEVEQLRMSIWAPKSPTCEECKQLLRPLYTRKNHEANMTSIPFKICLGCNNIYKIRFHKAEIKDEKG